MGFSAERVLGTLYNQTLQVTNLMPVIVEQTKAIPVLMERLGQAIEQLKSSGAGAVQKQGKNRVMNVKSTEFLKEGSEQEVTLK
ncbi:MAG: hypothetical protein HRT44_06875, partial [Bdellovibrionales bacterium]|nr:hypothetical protein [Bdellovibrionales bacterium]